MAGRKPTPKPLKKLRGNPRKERLNGASDPVFETAIPDAPDYLETEARAEWDRITTELAAKQLITHVDRAILAAYCQTYGDIESLSQQAKTAARFLETPTGYKYENPLHIRIAKLRKELQGYTAELGITPVARNKVKMIGKPPAEPTKEQSLAEKLFKTPVKK